jgi:hypothetical protein
MSRKIVLIATAVLVWLLLLGSGVASARPRHSSPIRQDWRQSGGHAKSPGASQGNRSNASGKHRKSSTRCTTCQRDDHGRIKRSPAAERDFQRQTGYPHGRKGYVIDHVVPLACGGADSPSNMQWQTKAEAKAKDKWERNGCRR